MLYLNKLELIGNLTRDPEIKTTSNGKMARIGIAVNRRYWHNDEAKEDVTFLNVTCFNERHVRIFEEYCRKGTQVYILAEVRMKKWTDGEGKDRNNLEIVMQPYRSELILGGRPQSQSENSASSQPNEDTGTTSPEKTDPESSATNHDEPGGDKGLKKQDFMSDVPF